MRVLLLTPPMTQLNTPYPATSYLTGFLRGSGVDAVQADLSIRVALRWLSRPGLEELAAEARRSKVRRTHTSVSFFLENAAAYLRAVGPVVRFLQNRDPAVAYRIVGGGFVPEGPRFASLDRFEGDDPLHWAFGALGLQDRARHLATLMVEDLADVVTAACDPHFGLVRYAERLAHSQASFDPLLAALEAPPTLVGRWADSEALLAIDAAQPDVIAITAPFAGNAYGAFRVAKAARLARPRATLVLGGGWVNTDLRELSDPRVFDFFDAIVLDAGERPLLSLLTDGPPVRTFRRIGGAVVFQDTPGIPEIRFDETGTPTTDGLPIGQYLGLLDTLNPMHRLWSDTRWNKLTVAHGCYWKKCSFCDTSLDYIRRYDPADTGVLVQRIERLIGETGQSGFHFVDEAAPPKKLRELAEALLKRDLAITWWGNIRFEKAFDDDLCQLLAASGCVAVTGGLEVASDRLLALMDKGVTVPQVARVTRAFADAGILTHAYLMYGFPTQTAQETVDALEIVRQLFEQGCLQSAYWHRFTATVHAPVARDPGRFGIRLIPGPPSTFGRNDVGFEDPVGTDHDRLAPGLEKGLYNFLHGVGLEEDVVTWFDVEVPTTTVPPDSIERALAER